MTSIFQVPGEGLIVEIAGRLKNREDRQLFNRQGLEYLIATGDSNTHTLHQILGQIKSLDYPFIEDIESLQQKKKTTK